MTRRRKKPKKNKSPERKKVSIPRFLSTITEHHCVPLCRGGINSKKNIIEVFLGHHMAWHGLFKVWLYDLTPLSYDLTPFEVENLVRERTFSQITKGNKDNNVFEYYWSVIFGTEVLYLEKKLIELEKMEKEGVNTDKDKKANKFVYFLMEHLIKNEGIKRGAYSPSELKCILKEILIRKKIKIIKNCWLPEKEEDKEFISDNPVTKIPDYLEYFK